MRARKILELVMLPLLQTVLAHPLVKFLAVGGLATAAQFAVLIALVEWQWCSAVIASALGYWVGAGVNYLLNYYFTFQSQQSHRATLPKFALVVLVGAVVNTLVFALVNSLLPWYWLSQCVATGASLIVNYLLHRCWIYRQD